MTIIHLTPAERKVHRSEAHHLYPGVLIGNDVVCAHMKVLKKPDIFSKSLTALGQARDNASLINQLEAHVAKINFELATAEANHNKSSVFSFLAIIQ
jgi:hypothetical protein